MKNERTVYTTRSCFPFTLFSSCNRKNENGYNGSYFYFSFFVWGLEKRKRMLGYPFSIFYYEIEKRKTKGRYIHGPGRFDVFFDLRLNKYESKQSRRQATGLDAKASRVKCPERFVSHLHEIFIYIWVVYSFCLFCCLFIIVTWWYIWCIVSQVASKRKYRHVW